MIVIFEHEYLRQLYEDGARIRSIDINLILLIVIKKQYVF